MSQANRSGTGKSLAAVYTGSRCLVDSEMQEKQWTGQAQTRNPERTQLRTQVPVSLGPQSLNQDSPRVEVIHPAAGTELEGGVASLTSLEKSPSQTLERGWRWERGLGQEDDGARETRRSLRKHRRFICTWSLWPDGQNPLAVVPSAVVGLNKHNQGAPGLTCSSKI